MAGVITFGLHGINSRICIDPGTAIRVAKLVEEAGFDSLWAGEHVVLPDPRTPESAMDPDDPIFDPVVGLTYVAGSTERVLLGTSVIILPQRQPLVLAKQLASLDVLSGGRLVVGIGAGYLVPELSAIGVPLAERGARTDEYLAAMREIWSGRRASFRGEFVSFEGITAYPLPMQRMGPRIVVGGHSEAAFRRAVEQAHGWYGWGMDPDRTARAVAEIRALEARYGRPAGLGPLEVTMTPPGWPAWVDREAAVHYGAAGVDRLVMTIGPLTFDELAHQIEGIATRMVGKIEVAG